MEITGKKVREPKQKRSINLKQKILETAIEIFSEKGFYNTSSNEISAAAGVSVGSFCSYYKDKKQLFIDVIEYFSQQIDMKIKIENSTSKIDKEEFIRKLLDKILLAHKIYPKFHKELAAMQLLDEDINKVYEDLERKTIDSYYEGLKMWKDQLNVENLEAVSYILYKSIDNIVHDIVINKTKIDEKLLLKELTAMISGYLFNKVN